MNSLELLRMKKKEVIEEKREKEGIENPQSTYDGIFSVFPAFLLRFGLR